MTDTADSQKRFALNLYYSYQLSDKLYNGTDELPNPGDESNTFQQQTAQFSWNAMDRLSLHLVFTRVDIHRDRSMQPDIKIQGLGDTALYANWSPWRGREGPQDWLAGFSFVAGMEFPTGEDEETPILGVTTPSLLQAGSGTYDPILGVRYQDWVEDFTWFHQSSVFFSLGESGADLKPGETFLTTTGVGYRFFDRLLPTFSIDSAHRGKDELKGQSIDNTGADLWFVTPAVSVRVSQTLSIDSSARVPFHRDVENTQLTPGVRWRIGLTWAF